MKLYVQKFYSAGEYGPFAHYSISRQSNTQSNSRILSEIPEIAPLIEDAGEKVIEISEEEVAHLAETNSEPNLIGLNENLIKHRIGEILWGRCTEASVVKSVLNELLIKTL